MLHKYLRPRSARGVPRRKHRRQGGERCSAAGVAKAAAPHPAACQGPAEGPASAIRFQGQELPRDPRLALCPRAHHRDGWPQARRQRVPACPSQRTPDLLPEPPRTYAGGRLRGAGPWPALAPAEKPRALGSSRPPSPGREPPPPCHPRHPTTPAGVGARVHTPHRGVHTIPHINSPSPPDTTFSSLHCPRTLSSPRPQTRCYHRVLREGGSQQGLCGFPPHGSHLPRKLLGIG